jgi:hypothetical protein
MSRVQRPFGRGVSVGRGATAQFCHGGLLFDDIDLASLFFRELARFSANGQSSKPESNLQERGASSILSSSLPSQSGNSQRPIKSVAKAIYHPLAG